MALIKSISGIRGTIGGTPGENLTPLDLVKFTSAYAAFIRSQHPQAKRIKVILGRDARISGPICALAVESTLRFCGVDVINIGMATTPTTEVAVTGLKAHGGIILTASHNPKQWNALKLLGSDGEFLNAAQGALILDLAASEKFDYVDVDSIGDVTNLDFNERHIDMVLRLKLVNIEAIRAKKYKIVVDAVNSIGGIVIPALLRHLGCTVIELNCNPDGDFAHNPEPLPEHLTEIAAAVVANKADLGIVVDPDVDRLAIVCEDGTMFGEEYTLVAVADYVLSKVGGNTVSNLSSSRALADVTARYGGTYAASAVGEVNVVEKMKQTLATIGGEGNGGVIYPELHYGRDALVGVALFLTYLAKKSISAKALRATFPTYCMSKNRVDLTPDTDVDAILATMAKKYAAEKVTTIDGVKIDFADSWVHLRKSNTEPIVRIYSEAPTFKQADELAARIKAEMVK